MCIAVGPKSVVSQQSRGIWHLQFLLSLMLLLSTCQARQNDSDGTQVPSSSNNTDLPNAFTSATGVKHWVSQSNYRGTFDIIWTSPVTIFISTYSMLCLNVPAPKDSFATRTGRRLLWMLQGILGQGISTHLCCRPIEQSQTFGGCFQSLLSW